ncbi:hypothetical protein [Falsiroseomonas sp. HW251]|uniref:hypothetical protein n=1 Tax=Falsiroseomonas sp. HW251 TaxID=3390998 RepID=UPI003D321766
MDNRIKTAPSRGDDGARLHDDDQGAADDHSIAARAGDGPLPPDVGSVAGGNAEAVRDVGKPPAAPPISPAPDPLEKLARHRCWIAWMEEPDENGKLNKVPRQANGRPGKTQDIRNRGTRAEAERIAAALPGEGRRGVGVVLGAVTGGWSIGAIDLDACVDGDGHPLPWAAALVEAMKSYTEVSPSGRGLHILFGYREADTEALRQLIGGVWKSEWLPEANSGIGKRPGIELIFGAGYVTFTGRPIDGFNIAIRAVSVEQVAGIVRHLDDTYPRAPKRRGEDGDARPLHRGEERDRHQAKKHVVIGEGDVGVAGFVRVVPTYVEGAALRLDDVPLQAAAAFVANSGKQENYECLAILPHQHMLELPGRNAGSKRGSAAIARALNRLVQLKVIKLIKKAKRPPHPNVAGVAATYDVICLHTFDAGKVSRPKLKVSRQTIRRAVQALHAAALRVLILAVARNWMTPADPFELSAEALAAEINAAMKGRKITPARILRGIGELTDQGWLVMVTPKRGRTPPVYRLGPMLYSNASPV